MTTLAIALLVASLRIVAAVAVLPLTGTLRQGRGAWLLRLLVAGSLCLVVWPVVLPGLARADTSTANWLLLGVRELGLGIAMGLSAAIVLLVGRLAGGFLDGQLPGWRADTAQLSGQPGGGPASLLFGLATLTIFVTVGGHIELLRAVLVSYRTLPPVAATTGADLVHVSTLALEHAGLIFVVAASAILPVLVVVALAEAMFGLVARALPSTASSLGESAAAPVRAAIALVAVLATLYASVTLLVGWMIDRVTGLA